MEDFDDRRLKFYIWLLILFLLATGFLFGWITREMKGCGGMDATHPPPNQFYDVYYASWQAPTYQETEIKAVLTAYNPVWWQTDRTPKITASGQKVKEGIIANNCLPAGSLVETSRGTFEVQDRMNKKYGCEHFDILMFNLEDARDFGRKVETIKVITF